jgi:tetratricopeptide (TPR) repeat protein
LKAKDSRAAIANFNKAIRLNPLFWDAWIRRGITFLDDGLYDEAESDFNHVLSVRSKDFKALYNRASLCLKTHRYEQACGDLEKAVRIRKKSVPAYLLLSEAYSKVGERRLSKEAKDTARGLKRK